MLRIILAVALLSTAANAQDADSGGGVTRFNWIARPDGISIYSPTKPVVTIRMDGSVEFGEGFTADEAAREFWKHLGQYMPNKCEVK